jgi:hypothetical protein
VLPIHRPQSEPALLPAKELKLLMPIISLASGNSV